VHQRGPPDSYTRYKCVRFLQSWSIRFLRGARVCKVSTVVEHAENGVRYNWLLIMAVKTVISEPKWTKNGHFWASPLGKRSFLNQNGPKTVIFGLLHWENGHFWTKMDQKRSFLAFSIGKTVISEPKTVNFCFPSTVHTDKLLELCQKKDPPPIFSACWPWAQIFS